MKIRWLGHACFLIDSDGVRILTDPFDESVPYTFLETPVDIVTVSHGHFDHNAVHRVPGDHSIIEATGTFDVHGVRMRGIASFHDDREGKERGGNIMFTFVVEGITIGHLGDLGAPLTAAQRAALADAEILLIPVGGRFTIDAAQAAELIDSLPRVRVVIPMHYRTDVIPDWPIAPVEEFEALMDNVRRVGASTSELSRESLPKQREVWILNHA